MASFGSMISVVATLIFAALLFMAFSKSERSNDVVGNTYPDFSYNLGAVVLSPFLTSQAEVELEVEEDITGFEAEEDVLEVNKAEIKATLDLDLDTDKDYDITEELADEAEFMDDSSDEEKPEEDTGDPYNKIYDNRGGRMNRFLFIVVGGDTLFGRPTSCQTNFQQSGSAAFDGIIDLHNDIMLALVFICAFILYLLLVVIAFFGEKSQYREHASNDLGTETHQSTLETVWTILPTILLLIIIVPSFSLLYTLDEIKDPVVTLKAIGRQ